MEGLGLRAISTAEVEQLEKAWRQRNGSCGSELADATAETEPDADVPSNSALAASEARRLLSSAPPTTPRVSTRSRPAARMVPAL